MLSLFLNCVSPFILKQGVLAELRAWHFQLVGKLALGSLFPCVLSTRNIDGQSNRLMGSGGQNSRPHAYKTTDFPG